MTLLLWLAAAHAQTAPLSLEVHGLKADTGKVLCSLFKDKETWLEDSREVANAEAAPKDGVATCTFTDIAPGTYAVIFIHDANDNGDMDLNWLGLPKEQWGASGNAKAFLSAPKFDDAAFPHPGELQRTRPQ